MGATLSTHVLDTARGVPAAGIGVTLFALLGDARAPIARLVTGSDGRTARPFEGPLEPGLYELVFEAGAYFAALGTGSFYDLIAVRFRIDTGETHYHVPLLLAPGGYTTYRGS